MVYLDTLLSQHYSAESLAAAVRTAIGKPLRRAAPLTQLALVGALACLPENRRHLPSALLWQSTGGPRAETQALLREVFIGSGEPMPYDFLATQPAIAAAQIKPYFPGLQSASYFPLAKKGIAEWFQTLTLAINWLEEERYAQILCAHLDTNTGTATGHWLVLTKLPLEKARFKLQLNCIGSSPQLPDTPDFPQLLSEAPINSLALQSPAGFRLALEFTRL